MPGPQTGRWEQFQTISPVPSGINLSTALLGHHPMVTSLLDRREVIIRLMKDGNEKNQPNPLQQDSPIPTLTGKQTLRQPTPCPSGIQWLGDLFNHMQPKFHLIPTFDSSELTLPPFVEPSQPDEPPIPGPSPSSKPHEPEPELVLLQPLCNHHRQYTHWIHPSPALPPSTPTLEIPPIVPENPISPNSYDEACQEFTDVRPTLMIPQAIIHKSINQILLEHHQLLHMIPFVDATH
ncbi:hypothetical protein O181_022262 [Austropuccinia psidii MF-1]|uniref:Uncharacterized protein n=1 Tax=Austropuccinia psidii MF-1 TaxID=1389203 RepID=A0A9Q3GWZ1_9BASI|nr:hypothetical protein [Austropuccinia psidii MF-1]